MSHIAYFQDGPLQGTYEHIKAPTGRHFVAMPPTMPLELRRFESDPIGPSFEVGVYEIDRLSRRFDYPGTSIGRVPTFTYVWKGTNNMRTIDNIHRLIGRPPHTLKHISECDEVIIDGATLQDLIRLAERAHDRVVPKTWAVHASVDGEVLPISLSSGPNGDSKTVDLPVRRAGEPHRLTIHLQAR